MNSVNSKTAKIYNKWITASLMFILGSLFFLDAVQAWEVDFSRRQLEFSKVEDQNRMPASVSPVAESPLGKALESVEPAKDIVILNTDKGFVPETIQLRQGGQYKIHIVNVNEQKKNVSFIMDSFGQHQSTVYGQPRTFQLNPKAEGVFSYQCPETAVQGRLVVVPESRTPASNK